MGPRTAWARTFCFSCITVCFTWWNSLHVAQQAAASTAFSAFSSCPAGGDGLQWVWRLEATQTQKDRLANGSPRRTHGPRDEWGRGAGDFTVLRSLTAQPDQGRDGGTPHPPAPTTLCLQLFPLRHLGIFFFHA